MTALALACVVAVLLAVLALLARRRRRLVDEPEASGEAVKRCWTVVACDWESDVQLGWTSVPIVACAGCGCGRCGCGVVEDAWYAAGEGRS